MYAVEVIVFKLCNELVTPTINEHHQIKQKTNGVTCSSRNLDR